MKTIGKWMMVVLALCMTLTVFASCSGGENGLVGKWRTEYGSTVEFKADGTCLFDGMNLQYTLDGTMLTLTDGEHTVVATIELDGDTLAMTNQENNSTLHLTRVKPAGASAAALVGKWESTMNGQTATLEFIADGKAYTQGREYADYSIEGDTIVMENIFGNSDNSEIYEFKLNGDTLEMSMNGETVVCTRVG